MESCSFAGHPSWQLSDTVFKDRLMKQIRVWWGTANAKYFPGPQPVSIERKDFDTLRNHPYWVCYKSDGVRYLFVCVRVDNRNYSLFVNRKMDMFLTKITTATTVFDGTVLDGELVYNRETKQHEYVVYDATIVGGQSVTQKPLSARLDAATSVVSHITRSDIPIKIKLFFPLRDFQDYVNDIVPDITHGLDGYVFTPEDSPVMSGTHYHMFKWKEQLKNTVDFRVEHRKNRRGYVLYLSKGKSLYEVSDTLTHPPMKKVPCIVECRYAGPHKWTPVLVREDKSHPNNYLTYTKTLYNIQENIQLEEFY
jgi:hypothetical protein